jgi:hypothetical protein
MDLDWFFELYLRQPKLPELKTAIGDYKEDGNSTPKKAMLLRWVTPNDMPFSMPIDVVVDGKTQRVEMRGGKGSVVFTGAAPIVDPNGWVLKVQ